MSIEAKIEELTAALTENTVALRDVLAASASNPPKKKTAKTKKAKPAPEPEPELTPDEPVAEEPAEKDEPVAEGPAEKDEPVAEEPAAKDEPKTADELVAEITEAVKNAITAPDASPDKVKKEWMAIREEFGVKTISELTDIEQLKDALEKAKAL